LLIALTRARDVYGDLFYHGPFRKAENPDNDSMETIHWQKDRERERERERKRERERGGGEEVVALMWSRNKNSKRERTTGTLHTRIKER